MCPYSRWFLRGVGSTVSRALRLSSGVWRVLRSAAVVPFVFLPSKHTQHCTSQERLHDFVPFLDHWAGIVVALTLVAIGLMGIYESLCEAEEEGGHPADEAAAAIDLVLAGEHRL